MALEKYYDIRIPDSGPGFERLSQLICETKFGCHFEYYGRQGQKQHGIDLFNKNFEICVQCKNYQTDKAVKMLLDGLEDDFLAAINKFHDSMHTYVLATTVPRDTAIQDAFAQLSKAHPKIEIKLLFWEDFQDALRKNPDLIVRAQYPSDADQKLQNLVDTLYEALCQFRCAINENDESHINSWLSKISATCQEMFDLGERYSKTQPDINRKCKKFVDQYNAFAHAYTNFVMANRRGKFGGVESATASTEFQALLTLSLEDNYTTLDILKQKLYTLLEVLYNALCEFRKIINSGDSQNQSTSLGNIAAIVQQVFSISERYSHNHPDLGKTCLDIVEQYNTFINVYRSFAIESQNGHSSHADKLAYEVNRQYQNLIATVLSKL